MVPLPAPELAQLAAKLQDILSSTPFASSSLQQLTGGTTSFVFLGTLSQPLEKDGGKEEHAIIKYAAPFASCHTEFLVDDGRANHEALMLDALQGFAPHFPSNPSVNINVPRAYYYSEEEKVQVIKYISSALPLHQALPTLPLSQTEGMGRALGTWLRAFHTWTSSPSQTLLNAELSHNKEVLLLKHKLTWLQGSAVLTRLQEKGLVVSEQERMAWEAAKQSAEKEVEEPPQESWIVHGDFWAGNVLVQLEKGEEGFEVNVIDFEFAHRSSRATDLGQFVGDLLERSIINPHLQPLASESIDAFLEGYGEMGEELKWRTAVYVGVYVVNWWSRGPPGRLDTDEEKRKRGVELVEQGLRWVRGGWERDKSAFEGTPLALLSERP